MATIRIKGDTSGYIDLAAPAVAGTTTVNLDKVPQTDQNVTFSKDAPEFTLQSTGTQAHLRLESITNNSVWMISNESNVDRMRIMHTNTSNSTNTFPMYIYEAGYVTTPSQPVFYAAGNGNVSYDGILFRGDVNFTNSLNVGNHYNYDNGRFTAPVAGRYMFIYIAVTENTGSHFVDINKNGVRATSNPFLNYGVIYQPGTNVIILNLAQGDYVTATRREVSGYDIYTSSFMGHLIG
jgi:hypothetical protein